jgi:hypothetical protein
MGYFKNQQVAAQEGFDTYRARVEARKLRDRENTIWWLSGLFIGIAFGMIVSVAVMLWVG